MGFMEGQDRAEISLLPPCIDDYVSPHAVVRVVDAFVQSLDLNELGFDRTVAAATGRPGFRPGDMLRLYIWGYLNQVRSSLMSSAPEWLLQLFGTSQDRSLSEFLHSLGTPPRKGSAETSCSAAGEGFPLPDLT